jgi:hypothetical protein
MRLEPQILGLATLASWRFSSGSQPGVGEQRNGKAALPTRTRGSMKQLLGSSREFEMITKVIEAFSHVDHDAATDSFGRRYAPVYRL